MKTFFSAACLIAAAVLVSGCTGLPAGLFGGNILNIEQNVVQENPRDILAIKSSQLIPSSPLLPNQDATLTFVLENKDNTESAENAIIDLYNAPAFRDRTGKQCNTKGSACAASECSVHYPCKTGGNGAPAILPGEQRQITFNLKSPTESDIAGIMTTTSLEYSVKYDFKSALVYIVPVVNMDEILKSQQSDKKITLGVSKAHSSGPVKIDVEMVGSPYILAGQDAVVSFSVHNLGSGNVIDSEIPVSDSIPRISGEPSLSGDTPGYTLPSTVSKGLAITFPAEFIIKGPANFDCQKLLATSETICRNKDTIDIYKGETMTTMRFTITPPANLDVPLRSYTIRATVGYTYEIRDALTVTVNPFQNV